MFCAISSHTPYLVGQQPIEDLKFSSLDPSQINGLLSSRRLNKEKAAVPHLNIPIESRSNHKIVAIVVESC